ncbi:MAG: hypothetical protein ACLGIA_06490 [Actinomycetes bacterium]
MDLEAPWRCRLRGVVWWGLPGARAREALEAQLGDDVTSGRRPVLVVGGLLEYLDTPVGPYREVLAGALLLGLGLPVVTVPFIAVDSPASVEAGRRNWALPKTVCSFERSSAGALTAVGSDWRVTAEPGRRPLPAPGLVRLPLVQASPDGAPLTSPLALRGWWRPCVVAVDLAAQPSLSDWFPAGRCVGAVGSSVTLRLGTARR